MFNEKMANLRKEIAKNQKEGEASWWPLEKDDGIEYEWHASGLVRGKYEDDEKWVIAEGKVDNAGLANARFPEIQKRLERGDYKKKREPEKKQASDKLAG